MASYEQMFRLLLSPCSSMFLEHITQDHTSELLCLLFPLSGHSPQISAWLLSLESSGHLSKATSSMKPSPTILVPLGPHDTLLLPPLLVFSPQHVSPPYTVYIFHSCITVYHLSPLPLLECKFHPSLNLFVYFCIPRASDIKGTQQIFVEIKNKQINRRCSINIYYIE